MNYNNTNRLALWSNNDRKKQSHPHLTGKGETIEPVYASAWFSDDISDADKKLLQGILARYESKKPFISVSLKSVAEASHGARQAVTPASQYGLNPGQQQTPPIDTFDDDIPFS